MSEYRNDLGQPIGRPLPQWRPVPLPPRDPMEGRFCRLVPLDLESHGNDLWNAYSADADGRLWTYLPYGPFADREAYFARMRTDWLGQDPLFHAIVERASNRAVGVASYLRILPEVGSIEVGHLCFSPLLQRTPLATEAMYLMMKRAFDLGYRRYEWKCDALNAPSNAAARRLGFTFEGTFRQCVVYKGRNRDTNWYSILDHEWPAIDAAFRRWLAAENFDAAGRQRRRLADLLATA